jgi:hypothetical protein
MGDWEANVPEPSLILLTSNDLLYKRASSSSLEEEALNNSL